VKTVMTVYASDYSSQLFRYGVYLETSHEDRFLLHAMLHPNAATVSKEQSKILVEIQWRRILGAVVFLLVCGWLASDAGVIPQRPFEEAQLYSDRFRNELQTELRAAADSEGMVLMGSLSSAYIDLTFNWLANLRVFGIDKHVVLIAEDLASFKAIRQAQSGARVVLSDFGHKKTHGGVPNYADAEYWALTGTRPWYVSIALDAGVTLVWSDQDIFYFQDIFKVFKNQLDSGKEMVFTIEGKWNGLCSGSFMIAPTFIGRKLVNYWKDTMRHRDDGFDQGALNLALQRAFDFYPDARPKHEILDEFTACSGLTLWRKGVCNVEELIFAHNNWIVGHWGKVQRFYCNEMWALPCMMAMEKGDKFLKTREEMIENIDCSEVKTSNSSKLIRDVVQQARSVFPTCPFEESY